VAVLQLTTLVPPLGRPWIFRRSEPLVNDRHANRTLKRDDRTVETLTLEERAYSVKKRFLAMYKRAHAGHIGSSLSCAEILVFLKFAWMRDDDTFVLSKGHAVAALYSLLAEVGILTEDEIDSFYQEGTRLSAHPPFNTIKQIPFATGSLGHGLSLSAGMALGATLNRHPRRFFCLTSDGELDEGSVWEAALFIAHRKLTSVVWLIDRNRIQATGRTEDVMALEPLDAKLRAFGFHVVVADGHDFGSLLAARDECTKVLEGHGGSAPVAIIANTVKGHGIRSMENTVDSHYLPMDDAQYAQALGDLALAHASAIARCRDAE
jgi:transketolase